MDNNVPDQIEDAKYEELDNAGETEDISDEKENRSKYPTQLVLTIRTIVGAYVIYLAYQIITSDGAKSIPIWAAVILFIVAGSALVIMSVKHFILGEYEGGRKDV